ncbi:MAG: M23 family metallopeptidase [Eubacteriales bacterium]|nr:M23 family metallopeptidase [Eubacteriales bacterium]
MAKKLIISASVITAALLFSAALICSDILSDGRMLDVTIYTESGAVTGAYTVFPRQEETLSFFIREPVSSMNLSSPYTSGRGSLVSASVSSNGSTAPDDVPVSPSASHSISLSEITRDGTFLYTVTVSYYWPEVLLQRGGNGNTSFFSRFPALFGRQAVYELSVKADFPASFSLSANEAEQGEIIIITVQNINEGETPYLEQDICAESAFFKTAQGYSGYLATGYYTYPGTYRISYGISGISEMSEKISVKPRNFKIQHLEVDPAITAETRNEAAYAEYALYFDPVRLKSSEIKYYEMPFAVPAYGRLSTEYGETRYVQGIPSSYRHSGLDIAAPEGSPVYAANNGIVVLSMYLTLTGNTVVIDHGQGLFSVYFHMHERFTAKGNMVKKGDNIGTIGSTGFSTGPHLHFTMSYYYINLEPGYYIAGEAITSDNYREHLTVRN